MSAAERALLHRGGRRGTWGSLGLWADDEEDYAQACEALARRVADAAALRPRARVLCVACGAGDELRLLASSCPGAELTGVERDAALVQAARTQLAVLGTQVRVIEGDGTALDRLGLAEARFDAVLCIDAAYHLRPREAFLRQAFALLAPGGRLAYTDLCLDASAAAWRAPLLRGAAALCGLSAQELLPAATQVGRLRRLGFAEVQQQRLDEAVLGGFARYVPAQGRRVARTAWHRDWQRVGWTARLIPPCRAAGLGYLLLSAVRPSSAEATA
jgi:SAM-dependent methyltransferase